jgi:hypothetical protein
MDPIRTIRATRRSATDNVVYRGQKGCRVPRLKGGCSPRRSIHEIGGLPASATPRRRPARLSPLPVSSSGARSEQVLARRRSRIDLDRRRSAAPAGLP